jgi:protein-tyrosine phosphatase
MTSWGETSLTDQFRVLTVCTGNMHRSPLAAALLGMWAHWYLDESVSSLVLVESAGTDAVVGAPMGEFTGQIARALGADGSQHRAHALTDDAATDADLILTATVRQRDQVVARVPSTLRRAFTVREAGRAAQATTIPSTPRSVDDLRHRVGMLARHRSRGADNIVDPQGQSEDVFMQMAAEEVSALAHVARSLLGMPEAEELEYTRATGDPATLRSLIMRSAGEGRM